MSYISPAVRLEMRAMWGSGDSNLLILANIRGEAPTLEETKTNKQLTVELF